MTLSLGTSISMNDLEKGNVVPWMEKARMLYNPLE